MTPHEAGQLVLSKLTEADLSGEERSTFKWPRCLVCRQRPTLLERTDRFLIFITGSREEPVVRVPRYDILPCCSAKYLKENPGPNRKQKIQIAARLKEKIHGPATVA
jgi:hypothetical protein